MSEEHGHIGDPEMPPEFVDAAELIGGLRLVPLPEGATAMEAVMMIKVMDAEGNVNWYSRYTPDLGQVEARGAAETCCDLLRRDIINSYIPWFEDEE